MADIATTSTEKTEFHLFLETLRHKKIYFEPLAGNHGDTLIVMGAKHVLEKAGCGLVEDPEKAEVILINGSGGMNDIWKGALEKLACYRKEYPELPTVVAPSSYRFKDYDFRAICEISQVPLILFARERISEQIVKETDLPSHVRVKVSHDLAFELKDSDFVRALADKCRSGHILIVARKDREGSAGVLAKTKGTWIPKKIRRPFSWMRDRLVAFRSRDVIGEILREENIPKDVQRIYRDVSSSVSFEEFLDAICGAALIVTDRLHVGILGHLLNKRVVLRPGIYHKIKGVYELSMSGPNSRTSLWVS